MIKKDLLSRDTAGMEPREMIGIIAELRSAMIVQQSEIRSRDELIGSQGVMLNKQSAMLDEQGTKIDAQKAFIAQQKHELEEKDRRIAEMNELIKLRTAVKYSPSSEQMQRVFPELEALLAEYDRLASGKDDGSVAVSGYVKKKRKKPELASVPAGTPVTVVDHTAGKPGMITAGGIVYVRDREDKTVIKTAYIPGKLIVEEHHYAQYRTLDADDGGKNKIVLYGSAETDSTGASPSLVAQLAVSKFDDHLPLYRQEEIFQRMGFRISRQKMASWILKFCQMLAPLEKLMLREVYSSRFINKDETRVQVLDVRGPDGKPSGSSFMYITIGSTFDILDRKVHAVVMATYIQGRSTDILKDDMERFGYDGPVMTDGLKSYGFISRRCICWVHAVRKFKEILKMDSGNVFASELLGIISGIYDDDEKLRKLLLAGSVSRGEFIELRRDASLPRIERFLSRADELRPRFSPAGLMGKAIGYIDEYRPWLSTYLDYVEATPSNNICERVAKSFATGRKNWLFCQSIDGADASALCYSLVETAKLQGISPLDYLEYVFTLAPDCRTEDDWRSLLPWNFDISRISGARSARMSALPDPGRQKPYIICGAGR
ncbi:MAG: IS66 family transposase [Sphaerochaetaceae bacterium]|jgi:transposase